MSTAPELVFVYGTLRHGGTNHRLVAPWATEDLRNAHAPGLALYLPPHGGFPYAIQTTTGHGAQGDLIRIPATDWPIARTRLDGLEGYDPRNPEVSHYLRTRTTVHLQGRTYTAWVYVAGPTLAADIPHTMRHLPSGIWPPATPQRGALLIAPTTHTTMTPLNTHQDIDQALDGTADEPLHLATGLLLWTRHDALHSPDCDPNPLASLLPLADQGTALIYGPALITTQDRHGEPQNLTPRQAATLIDHCLHLAQDTHALQTMTDACTIRRSWIS